MRKPLTGPRAACLIASFTTLVGGGRFWLLDRSEYEHLGTPLAGPSDGDQRHEVHPHQPSPLGWVLIILGVIQLTGGFSLMAVNV
jgi:hypothetical protein